jgi:ferredoxin/flavodoxin
MDAVPARRSRISLLYYSGAGGTKLVAELLGEILSVKDETCVAGVKDPRAAEVAADSDLLVFCYPTYFLRPAPSMREFIEGLGPFDPPRASYIVTTDELYSENSIRACALMLKARGIFVIGSKVVRAPGTDLTCILPGRLLPWLYRFERGFPRKLRSIAEEIDRNPRGFIPAPKWYTPIAQLLQVAFFNRFERWRGRFRVLPDRCTLCGACAAGCDRGAWSISAAGLIHDPERCELCTRCIHRCPNRAIVLVGSLKDNPRLDSRLYASLKEDARKRLIADRALRAKERREA